MPSTHLSPFFSRLEWIGPYLQECCLHEPGMARQLASADTARWQLIALFALKSDTLPAARAASILANAPLRSALEALTGMRVAGARGVLSRFSSDLPVLRQDAEDLLSVLSDVRMVRALRGLHLLEHGQLRPLVLLPRDRDWADLMSSIGSCHLARDTACTIVRFITANEPDLSRLNALQAVKSRGQLRAIARSFLEERELSTPPWSGSDGLEPVKTAADLAQIGKRYGLCLKNYIAGCLAGKSVIYTLKEPFCAIELQRVSDGWRLGQIRAANNFPVAQDVVDEIERRLTANIKGLMVPWSERQTADEIEIAYNLGNFAFP